MKKHIRNFLLLTTLTSLTIYSINKFISISSAIKNLLKTDAGKFYNWKYGKIFYTQTGKGSPVLLIHDLNPASSSQEWEKIYKSLSKNHTVYTLDLPGCGRSDKPNLTYTNYMYVQLLRDFIKNIIEEKADIVVMGGSASFGVMSCNMNPEYFNKVILVNPEDLNSLAKCPSKRKNTLKFFIDLPIFGTLIYNILFSLKSVDQKFRKDYYYNEGLISSKLLDIYYESAHIDKSHGRYLFSSIKSYYTNINIVHALKKINNSIYLIYSKENEDTLDIANSYCFYNSSIETAGINNSKYLPQLETPHEFLSTLELFLNTK